MIKTPKNKVASFRLTDEEFVKLKNLAKKEGKTISDFLYDRFKKKICQCSLKERAKND